MIVLERLNGHPVMLNCDLIESVEESNGATVVTLTTGNAVVVSNGLDEIREKVVEFKRRIHASGATGA
ncbi:MAG TPA: flagellar FlbD family protein [Candidatus Baltobacteraceae bacterium]|nr:flagellar FlbD family protein [Candidatus Baltobacteraceae bacterium]